MNDSAALKSILLLAANPRGTVSLRLQEEEREIKERLRLAGYGKVPINSTVAARTRDIQQAMVDFKPQIVHFTGHGAGKDGLAFEDVTGQLKLVDSDALANLFKLFSSRVECVVLNACYSEFQAEAIAQHIDYVIGMNQAIGDRAAIEFSVGFYTALGAGESIEFAYELGCNAIHLAGGDERLTPILKKNTALLSRTLPISEIMPASSSQISHGKTSETKWVLVLNATLGDDLSREQLEIVIERLRNLSRDQFLRVDGIESGSITIKLDGSEEGFKVIQTLYKEGKLTELLGLTVKYVGYEVPDSNSTGKRSTVEVFFSYSHKDEDLRDELVTHLSILERDGVISGWCDREISAGEEWANEIDERINAASIILLLVSSDFIASNYCWNIEVKRAMERHQAGDAYIIPVILRPVNWGRAPFGKIQALPKNAKPVTSWSNCDEAFLNISQGIEAVVRRFK